MSLARHLVARQKVEVVAFERATAEGLAQRTSAAAARLSATIERLLDARDTPGLHLRFDRIELDLGALDPVRWEDALAEAVGERLDAALTGAIRSGAAAAQDEADAAQALLAEFGATGRLPWWSGPDASPAAAVAVLARAGGEPAAIRALLARATTLERLIVVLDDSDLAILLRLAQPMLANSAGDVLRQATERIAGARNGATPDRVTVWRAILSEAGTGPVSVADVETADAPELFAAEVAKRLSPAANTPAAGDVHQAIATDQAFTLIEAFARPGDIERLIARLDDDGLTALQLRSWPALPADAVSQAWRAIERSASLGSPPRAAFWRSVLGAAVSAGQLAPEPASAALERLIADVRQRLASERSSSSVLARIDGELDPTPTTPADFAHDAIAVTNAGLVLLAAFLPAFFDRIGLVEDKAFRNEAFLHRAAMLIDHLATGEPAAPEFLLALPKLLVGLDLEAVIRPGEPLIASEIVAAQDLLKAVLGHLSAFGEMSVAGFRATWLQRAGSLTTRDGGWLLRIEGQAYDVLLEKVPWRYEWVRLPWMSVPLQVEW